MTPEDKSLQLFAGSLNLEHLIKKQLVSMDLLLA